MIAAVLLLASTLHVVPFLPPPGAPKHAHSGMTCWNSRYEPDMGIAAGHWTRPHYVTNIEKLLDARGTVVGVLYHVRPDQFLVVEANRRMSAHDRAQVAPLTVPGDEGARMSIYNWSGPAHHSVAVPVSRFPFTRLRAVPCTGSDWSRPNSYDER